MSPRWLSALVLHACGSWAHEVSYRYGMMIDAGSEGSRLYIFRWLPSQAPGVVTPESVGSKAISPGIASFALKPEAAGHSLKPLLHYAEDELKHIRSQWAISPLFLRATAGMRLLNSEEREAVLASVRKELRQSPFLFQDAFALVATGEEEGLYGWLTVNAQMGNLRSSRPIGPNNSVGALDLGGASVQIAFIPEKSVMSHAFPVRLGRQTVRVYSTSFLHFGQREAAHKVSGLLISDALLQVQSVDTLIHPCYATGYTYHPRFSYYKKANFPIDVKMHGTSDYQSCERLIKRIFRKEANECLLPSCSFYGTYQPHVYNNEFVGFSHFTEIAEFLALPPNPSLSDLRVATEYLCSLSHDQLHIIFSRVKDKYNRVHLCFHSAYALVLLTYGFGFKHHSRQIDFRRRDSADAEVIDYVFGAMFYEINQDPWLQMNASNATALLDAPQEQPQPAGPALLTA